jgi:hypothetical protein
MAVTVAPPGSAVCDLSTEDGLRAVFCFFGAGILAGDRGGDLSRATW